MQFLSQLRPFTTQKYFRFYHASLPSNPAIMAGFRCFMISLGVFVFCFSFLVVVPLKYI